MKTKALIIIIALLTAQAAVAQPQLVDNKQIKVTSASKQQRIDIETHSSDSIAKILKENVGDASARKQPHKPELIFVLDGKVVPNDSIRSLDQYTIESTVYLKDSLDSSNDKLIMRLSSKEEYDVLIFDPDFDLFLARQEPKSNFTVEYLKSRNMMLSQEWNQRCQSNPRLLGSEVYYSYQTNYGLDVEYKLYMFYRFMKEKGLL